MPILMPVTDYIVPMKRVVISCFWRVALVLALVIPGRAATITWTNTAAGYWSMPANWSPNQVPGAGDTAVIPIAATNGAILDMTASVQNLILNGGAVYTTDYSYDTLTVNGQINWTNGILGCLVTNNGVMTLAGTKGVDYSLLAYFYNAGTINLASGNLLINYCGGNSGSLYNAPGALLNFQQDAAIDISQNQFGLCSPPFNNAGTIRKSGGTGTNYIYPPLYNSSSATVDAQTGAISLNGGGVIYGTLQSEGTGALLFGTNIYGGNNALTFDGNLTSTNAFLNGVNLVGTGTNYGVLTWISGSLAQGDGALTIAKQGELILAGSTGVDYALSAALYNAGTIKLVSGNLLVNFCGSGEGGIINTPSGVVDIEADVSIDSPCDGQINNEGIVRKSGGTGTTDIGAFFNNGAGILDAQTGTLGLTNNYNLGGGILNFGISTLADYGRIYLSGLDALSGELRVNLNNGYAPTNGNAFPLLTYGAEYGAFANQALPAWINWLTNYSSTTFTLTVSNLDGQPELAAAAVPTPGQFSLQFAGNPNGSYSVLATTNLVLPVANWTTLGPATLLSNDLFGYVDQHTTNYPRRFYRLRSP